MRASVRVGSCPESQSPPFGRLITYLLSTSISAPTPRTEAQRKFKHSRVVGFLVEPYSIKHTYEGTWPSDPEAVRGFVASD